MTFYEFLEHEIAVLEAEIENTHKKNLESFQGTLDQVEKVRAESTMMALNRTLRLQPGVNAQEHFAKLTSLVEKATSFRDNALERLVNHKKLLRLYKRTLQRLSR